MAICKAAVILISETTVLKIKGYSSAEIFPIYYQLITNNIRKATLTANS